jgi:hypothetical protein
MSSPLDPSVDEVLLMEEKQYGCHRLKPIGVSEKRASSLNMHSRHRSRLNERPGESRLRRSNVNQRHSH